MKILITGGAGFVGSNLTAHFLKQRHEVTVVDNLITGQYENIEPFLSKSRFKYINCSIDSEQFNEFVPAAKGDFDRIYHLACPTGVPNIEKLGDEMLTACSFGTMNVLNLALSTGAKFLFSSSSEVYGQPEVFPQKECYTGNVDTLGARANYEEGKRFSETLVRWFFKSRGIDGRIVRFFNVYGPNMSLTDQRLLPVLATQALQGLPLTVQGDGSQRRTHCYISEILKGLELIMEKGEAGRAYNLGSDKEVSVLDFAKIIIDLTGTSSKIVFVDRPNHDHQARLPDLNEVKALGWSNNVNLKDGLRLSLIYFKNNLNYHQAIETERASSYLIPNKDTGNAYI